MKELYIVLPLAVILCLMVGCQDRQAISELAGIEDQAKAEDLNKKIVLRFYEEIDKQNFDTVLAMFAPDAQIYVPGGFEAAKPEERIPMLPQWFTSFPDYAHHIHDVIAEGDKVAVRMTFTGTHEGEFRGAPPTGNFFKYLGIHMHTLKDGKIVELWVVEDLLYLMQQLGMELKPKEGEQ
jgi:steroid delta-isomerase-like uncharacterized protein